MLMLGLLKVVLVIILSPSAYKYLTIISRFYMRWQITIKARTPSYCSCYHMHLTSNKREMGYCFTIFSSSVNETVFLVIPYFLH